ncbi:ThuA domain-containing protein [Catenovulum sp. 2E275]|uniref:ThuA domain-containing protein n=1 Tax=Catenovulum sp. 2E275 TaxID=2980497 RepID=UPI0021D0A2D5|nr:ThuA domain-containing protein [Catenovulum sp. 2E275]MCU4677206.1 ThuA domain-containing protein [Catenovulum sp. 2E275]
MKLFKFTHLLWSACFIFTLSACQQADKSENLAEANSAKQDNQLTTKSVLQPDSVLIFSKTAGWRHDSIEVATKTIADLVTQQGLTPVVSEDANLFTDDTLKNMAAVVFVNTTGDVLNQPQQIAMERYIQAGGGFVGVHSATDTEHETGDWYWYRRLVGGVFKSHPGDPSNVQKAQLKVVNANHPATETLPEKFSLVDEWYDFVSLSDRRHDLITLDERSYQGGLHGAYHPIAWYHEFDGGRAFYTGIGHSKVTYQNALFLEHLAGGLRYAIGQKNPLDYTKSRPDPRRFQQNVIVKDLKEPVSFDLISDYSAAIITERNGRLLWVDIQQKTHHVMAEFKVFGAGEKSEFGLVAVTLDPDFLHNQLIYLMYDTPDKSGNAELLQRLSQFKVIDKKLDLSSEQVLFEIPFDNTCCHTGGNLEFDNQGNLYIAIGDNTNPFESNDSGPISNIEDRKYHDALRTSANTQDLRGKILRITPDKQGGYSIPSGNLFTSADQGRAEIYVMGVRNPYTIAVDNANGDLYFGDIGPDGKADTETFGPRGYDEINKVSQAGFFGWPAIIGNNIPYRMYDYKNQKSGKLFNPLAVENFSPRNTGLKVLPEAQSALIWYPYARSERFPELGQGGRNALVAGVYPAEKQLAYPEYYQHKLIISDFMRGWLKVVSLDEFDDVVKIENLASDIKLGGPLDLKIAADGRIWVLEYGAQWWPSKAEAQLSVIEFNQGELKKWVDDSAVKPEALSEKTTSDLDHQARLLIAQGKQITKDTACIACHTEYDASVGPAFAKVAAKYGAQTDAKHYIATTIATGSSGKWGEHIMPAHNFLDEATRLKIAAYILSLPPAEK